MAEVSVWPEAAQRSTGLEATVVVLEDRWGLQSEDLTKFKSDKSHVNKIGSGPDSRMQHIG